MTHQHENPDALAGAGDLAAWQIDRKWRALPYVKAYWNGPKGHTLYLADRDYCVIAYRKTSGEWARGFSESLHGCAMHNAAYIWTPGIGESPEVNPRTLTDLITRCSRHRATAWLIEEVTR